MNAASNVREKLMKTSKAASYHWRVLAHRSRLPKLSGIDREIADGLEALGTVATGVASLGIDGTQAMLIAGDALMQEMEALPRRHGAKDYLVTPSTEHVTRHPEIIRWGLDERFLSIAENYIGTPVTYRGVLARIDYPDGTVRETRVWHLDQEDFRILKIVVYLEDVDEAGGPFEYIPANIEQPIGLAHGSKLRIDDEDALARRISPNQWRALTGPRGTVGFTDTCRVFHRGRLPTRGARKSLFFAYNSHRPMRPDYCGPMFDVDRFRGIAGPLTERQKTALDFGYLR